MPALSPERRAGLVLLFIILAEGAWVVSTWVRLGGRFVSYMGFAPGQAGGWPGWLLSALVTTAFIYSSARLPSVRENLFRPSFLKLLAIGVAVFAGILEEVFFRKLLMDWVADQSQGVVVQILASGVVFGALHAIWGIFGRSMGAALGAFIATGILGLALGIVYVAADRSLAPCIVAHFLIDLFAEPGLMLAAVRGEMGRTRRKPVF